MVVIIHCVFIVIIANYCICQANEVSENIPQKNTDLLVTLTTTPSTPALLLYPDNNTTTVSVNDTEQDSSAESDNDVVPWNVFLDILTSVSLDQLKKVKSNINSYYYLNQISRNDFNTIFNASDSEYAYLLSYKIKQIVDEKKLNESEEFMLDFLDQSNFVIEKILEYNLNKLDDMFLSIPTNWHGQTLKDKIFRQQAKTSSTLIEMQICNMAAICKEREHYTDYIIEWLRCLLNEDDATIKEVFNAVPVIVDKYSGFIKSNTVFRKNLQYASKISPSAQRDVIDFIDETITNEKIFTLIPDELKKCGVLLIDLLNVINDVYEFNDDNYEDLETISQMFLNQNGDAGGIKDILDAIIKNVQKNFKRWPKEKQAKIHQIWLQIIFL